jgi:hypothetical protein
MCEESTDEQRATMPHTLLTVSDHMARVTLHYPPANVLTHARPLTIEGARS